MFRHDRLIWDKDGARGARRVAFGAELRPLARLAARRARAFVPFGLWWRRGPCSPAPDHLQPTAPVDERGVSQLVTELDSKDFKARQKAREALEQLEDLAAPVLRRMLAGELSAESRRSVNEILGKTDGPVTTPTRLQSLRAIEALEQIGTLDAKKVLQTLSQGAPQARLTQEAQASLVRLAKRAESSR